ncbi:hypothetical protein [Kitasatospora herbaricolor]|uniref:hypothetical protein n=1 Tax=Kitasatospora herbaricolor TaxID=68217 RepID=UPI0036D7C8F1
MNATTPSTLPTARTYLAVVAKYVLWVHLNTGYPLDEPEEVFLHHLIRRYARAQFRSDESLYRQANIERLKLIARNLGDDDPHQELTWPATPKGLYSDADKAALAASARARNTDRSRGNMQIIVALGFGAGLRGDEIATARVADITITGDESEVRVHGKGARVVPVGPEWVSMLDAGLAGRELDGYALLGYRYGRVATRIITDHHVWMPDEPHPSPQRMRSTWIVEQWERGMPTETLRVLSGYKDRGELRKHIRKFRPEAFAGGDLNVFGGVA